MRLAVGRGEVAVGKQRRAAPLHLVALGGQRLDASVERDGAGNLPADGRGVLEAHLRRAPGRRAPSPRETPTIPACADPMRRPGISGEKITRRSVEVSVPPPGDS